MCILHLVNPDSIPQLLSKNILSPLALFIPRLLFLFLLILFWPTPTTDSGPSPLVLPPSPYPYLWEIFSPVARSGCRSRSISQIQDPWTETTSPLKRPKQRPPSSLTTEHPTKLTYLLWTRAVSHRSELHCDRHIAYCRALPWLPSQCLAELLSCRFAGHAAPVLSFSHHEPAAHHDIQRGLFVTAER